MGIQTESAKKVHVNTASLDEKEVFEKKDYRTDICGQAAVGTTTTRNFTIVSIDKSFFFYNSLVRHVWIDKKRPVVRVTGSHQHSCIFGAISIEGKQLLGKYDKFNGNTFLEFLKKIHDKFSKFYLFMDKVSPNYKAKKVMTYFEENKDTHSSTSSNYCITRVHGYGRDMEYCKTRSAACLKILCILCRFEKQDFQIF
jgi:hypothetical protein